MVENSFLTSDSGRIYLLVYPKSSAIFLVSKETTEMIDGDGLRSGFPGHSTYWIEEGPAIPSPNDTQKDSSMNFDPIRIFNPIPFFVWNDKDRFT